MSDFWQDEGEFRDNPVEVQDGNWKLAAPSAAPHSMASNRSVSQNLPASHSTHSNSNANLENLNYSEIENFEEEDHSEVLADARLRLEQGKLYELIMKNDLFQDMDADPRAVKNVQREIKRFAKERMEIMLGMRTEYKKEEHNISLPFNDLEIDVLKRLASKASGGVTESNTSSAQETKKNTTLTPISNKQTQTKPLLTQPKAPIERRVSNKEVVKENTIQNMPEPKTLEERNLLATMRQQGKKAKQVTNKLPMPTVDQLTALYASRSAESRNGSDTLIINRLVSEIIGQK